MEITELYSKAQLAALEKKNRIRTGCLIAFAALLLTVCILLCALTRTANEEFTELAAILTAVIGGWAGIAWAVHAILPGRREAAHARHMLTGEREAITGILTVTGDTVPIRNSIVVRKLLLDNGGEVKKIHVNERLLSRLPGSGTRVTLYTVHNFAAAFSGGDGAPAAPPPRSRRRRRLFSRLHLYALWGLLAAFFWAWIFNFVTDAPAERKIVVFVEAAEVEDKALSLALEEDLPEGIRMIRVHPFSYAMFSESTLTGADIYIVRGSAIPGYIDSFLPLKNTGGDDYILDGVAYGRRIYDGAAGSGGGTAYIRYEIPGEAPEDYYLCFGAASVHTGQRDTAAYAVAERLMELD